MIDDRDYGISRVYYFALCLSSRPIYIVEAPILAGFITQQRGAMRVAEFLVTTGASLLLINGPIFLSDPDRFPVFLSADKLAFYPASVHAPLIIPAISLAIASCAFLVRMSRPRVFLYFGVELYSDIHAGVAL